MLKLGRQSFLHFFVMNAIGLASSVSLAGKSSAFNAFKKYLAGLIDTREVKTFSNSFTKAATTRRAQSQGGHGLAYLKSDSQIETLSLDLDSSGFHSAQKTDFSLPAPEPTTKHDREFMRRIFMDSADIDFTLPNEKKWSIQISGSSKQMGQPAFPAEYNFAQTISSVKIGDDSFVQIRREVLEDSIWQNRLSSEMTVNGDVRFAIKPKGEKETEFTIAVVRLPLFIGKDRILLRVQPEMVGPNFTFRFVTAKPVGTDGKYTLESRTYTYQNYRGEIIFDPIHKDARGFHSLTSIEAHQYFVRHEYLDGIKSKAINASEALSYKKPDSAIVD